MFTTLDMPQACTARVGLSGPQLTYSNHTGGRPGGGPAPLPLTPVDGEVLVVGRALPVPAPSPADRTERRDQGSARVGHARPDLRPVGVGGTGPGADADSCLNVGVLDCVDVDCQPVGVHRPLRRSWRDRPAAIESRGVIR